jgi:hypothetical protein
MLRICRYEGLACSRPPNWVNGERGKEEKQKAETSLRGLLVLAALRCYSKMPKVFDLDRADPLYPANQERKYPPSVDARTRPNTFGTLL